MSSYNLISSSNSIGYMSCVTIFSSWLPKLFRFQVLSVAAGKPFKRREFSGAVGFVDFRCPLRYIKTRFTFFFLKPAPKLSSL